VPKCEIGQACRTERRDFISRATWAAVSAFKMHAVNLGD
jgi:hypothetical protein